MKVRLEGITRKGKNRVREHGNIWNVIVAHPNVNYLGGKLGLLIESLGNTLKIGKERVKDKRWVALKGDSDFKVEIIEYD